MVHVNIWRESANMNELFQVSSTCMSLRIEPNKWKRGIYDIRFEKEFWKKNAHSQLLLNAYGNIESICQLIQLCWPQELRSMGAFSLAFVFHLFGTWQMTEWMTDWLTYQSYAILQYCILFKMCQNGIYTLRKMSVNWSIQCFNALLHYDVASLTPLSPLNYALLCANIITLWLWCVNRVIRYY